MKSQSVSVQEDLQKNALKKDSNTITDNFDAQNAYMDLSSSHYQEKLISKIVEDPKIDKNQFLSKLISRVSSQDPEYFA